MNISTAIRRLPVLLGLLLATGCTAQDETPNGDTVFGGKGDSLRCESARIDASGYCRASDGTFAEASCCEASTGGVASYACTYDAPIFAIDNTVDLDAATSSAFYVWPDTFSDQTDLLQRQIRAAVAHLTYLDGSEPIPQLFDTDITDEGFFWINQVVVADVPFEGNWIQFYSGDTEIGVVFDSGTMTIVAEISDGDVMSCALD